ncbi:MAG: Holliday junction resolvase RuvX [Deltaproteobacteria bacterium]|nr:Holliday junction resolvase RuvX [Deltaproteobacteria bacterium]
MQERILCLDVGDRRIGLAVSDPFGRTAQGLATIERRTFKKDCGEIFKIIQEYGVEKIIIGLPLDLTDAEGPQAKKVRFFKEGLEKFLQANRCQASIDFFDESYSSREAEAILLEADLGRKKRKKIKDKLAAALILQKFLDEK